MATISGTPSKVDADTFTAYSDALQAAALTTTRLAATSLPTDLSFHRSIDPALARDIDEFSDRVLSLASKLVHIASGKTNRIHEEEDVVDQFVRNVVDPMEGMLESTDIALDVFLGKRKEPAIHVPPAPVVPSQNKSQPKQQIRGRLDPALTHARHIQKPQLSFKCPVSNTDESPYIPATLLPHKWCAKVPLGYVFHDNRPHQGVDDGYEDENEEEGRKRTSHPYYHELTHPSYPDHVYNPPVEPVRPPSLETSPSEPPSTTIPLTFVSTPKAFLAMANTISSATELAVDLEHHSYRSYRGFLALMQISTRQGDFVVDLLVPEIREGLRQEKGKKVGKSEETRMATEAGKVVARVFADPSVIKVFHGAESDVVWLQQDFNIFVVGLFDTFHASKLLEYPKHSLAYLLETCCDFMPDKRYQLADWRIRPLPTEMLTYARSDTHFLLYIYDTLRLSLIERSSAPSAISEEDPLTDTEVIPHGGGLIHRVLTRSSRTALRLYNVEAYDAEGGTGTTGWATLARKWNKIGLVGSRSQTRGMEVQQLQAAVYKAVHRWREDVAREEDESTRYVLQTHQLFLLAERVPTTVPDLLSLFGGPGGVSTSIPPVLRCRTRELVAIIKGAMEVTKPVLNPQGSAEDGHEDAEMSVSTVVEESQAMNLATLSAPPTAELPDESRLWTVSSSATSVSIPRSSLFGVGISGERLQRVTPSSPANREESYSATGSVLFGSALSKSASTSSSSTIKSTFTHAQVSDHSQRFKNLMEKIHKTLVIAPSMLMPSLPPSVKLTNFSASMHTQALETSLPAAPIITEMRQCEPDVLEPLDSISPCPASQVEIPFVPAHKRQTLLERQEDSLKNDATVVVGQAGAWKRKRKRDKAKANTFASQSNSGTRPDGAETSAPNGDHTPEVEEFDYSSVPNLLDDEGMHGDALYEEGGRRKKKQRQGKGSGLLQYGDFRGSPQDQREVRGGNKTHTFR